MWILALILFIIGMTLLTVGAKTDKDPLIASAFVLFLAGIVVCTVA